MNMITVDSLTKDILAINRARLSGSPAKIRLVWRQARTLSQLASQSEQHPAPPPVRRISSILNQLANRTEAK